MLVRMAAMGTHVSREAFGNSDGGAPVERIVLESASLKVTLLSYGARIVSVEAPDRDGKRVGVVLGTSRLRDYVDKDQAYLGAVVGRYANRIDRGRFVLDGHEYELTTNDKGNTLHGGVNGFDRRLWAVSPMDGGVEMSLVSEDGDQGFPGRLLASVRYTLEGSRLRMEYRARSDKATVVSLTNHAYFNLAGEGQGTILNHELMLAAHAFTPVNERLIPTGELRTVEGTAFNFRNSTKIGQRMGEADEQLRLAGGYDHNWMLDGAGSGLRLAARALDAGSGRTLTVYTTEPGIQFYSGNFLAGEVSGFSGRAYGRNMGFCLETQKFPDSPNHADFPSARVEAGEEMKSETVYEFGFGAAGGT